MPTPDNPHDDPLIALAEQAGRFTASGHLDTIARIAQETQAYPKAAIDTALLTFRAIQAEAKAGLLKAMDLEAKLARLTGAKGGHLPVVAMHGDLPDEDPQAIVKLAARGGRRVFIIGLKPEAMRGLGPRLTNVLTDLEAAIKVAAGLPMADPEVPTTPAEAGVEAIDLLDELVASDSIQGEHRAEARRILGLEPEEDDTIEADADDCSNCAVGAEGACLDPEHCLTKGKQPVPADLFQGGVSALPGGTMTPGNDATPACTHPETRQETHTYCATPDGCGACLG